MLRMLYWAFDKAAALSWNYSESKQFKWNFDTSGFRVLLRSGNLSKSS